MLKSLNHLRSKAGFHPEALGAPPALPPPMPTHAVCTGCGFIYPQQGYFETRGPVGCCGLCCDVRGEYHLLTDIVDAEAAASRASRWLEELS